MVRILRRDKPHGFKTGKSLQYNRFLNFGVVLFRWTELIRVRKIRNLAIFIF